MHTSCLHETKAAVLPRMQGRQNAVRKQTLRTEDPFRQSPALLCQGKELLTSQRRLGLCSWHICPASVSARKTPDCVARERFLRRSPCSQTRLGSVSGPRPTDRVFRGCVSPPSSLQDRYCTTCDHLDPLAIQQ